MAAQEMLSGQEGWAGGIAAIRSLPLPVVAAVNGPAVGPGFALALAADIRLAAERAIQRRVRADQPHRWRRRRVLDASSNRRLRHAPFGVRLTKQVLQTNVDSLSPQAAIELENRNQVLATRTADMVEALAAFREKRLPKFTGR
jgi:enoyl-CoA hydratase/carnithine racemase